MIDLDTLTDQQIVARTLDGEAGNQGINGITGVGCVIQNRFILRWQRETTARGVCLHHMQFDCWLLGPDLDRIMSPDYVEPTQCTMIADQILKGILTDITFGATHYFDDSISPPSWADPDKFTIKIGRLNFYCLA